MKACAQTSLQLFNQLREAGYAEAELERIGGAYELAARLLTGTFRPSGKSFLAHLVGTASILASLGARPATVAAGLLHSAYTHGEFGNGWRGIADDKRERVGRAVGEEVEDLVARYTALRWSERTLPGLRERLDALGRQEREVLLMRLANELEDYLDLGALYCRDAERRREAAASWLRPCVDMAERLGFPELAADLARAFDETAAAAIPAALRQGQWASFLIAPASHSLRPMVVLRRLVARLARR